MFKINEFAIHPNHGVCLIKEIESLTFEGISNEYYVLTPYFGNKESVILKIPVDNDTILTPTLSRSEINKIFEKINLEEDYWNDNPMKRTLEYKDMFASKNYVLLGTVIRSIENRKRAEKKLSATDKKIFENAKMIFFGICSIGLNIPYEKVEDHFFKKVNLEK